MIVRSNRRGPARRLSSVTGFALGWLSLVAMAPTAELKPLPLDPISGIYISEDGKATLRVKRMEGTTYRLVCSEGWQGVGLFDGRVYQGVFRYRGHIDPNLIGLAGLHAIQWNNREDPTLYATHFDATQFAGRKDVVDQHWHRTSTAPDSIVAGDSLSFLPETGDMVYVEELPEPIHKVAPVYPEAARRAGIEGTVVIKALVLEDGAVGDLLFMKSVPALDQAALDSVRLYRFKPARSGGRPIAVWVAIPIRFSLK